jgi:hypothetical protein
MKDQTPFLVRQGDVLFTRITEVPKGLQKIRPDGAAAYGEVTGHSHSLSVASRDFAEVFEVGEGLYVRVSDSGEVGIGGATFVHEEHGPITLPTGNYRVTIQREYSPEAILEVRD